MQGMHNMLHNTVTLSNATVLAQFVAELTRQGIAFTVRETPSGEFFVIITGY